MLIAALPAWGKWEEISKGNDNDGVTYNAYIDIDSIRHSENLVKFWLLIDKKQDLNIGSKEIHSVLSQLQFDCKEENQRQLYSTNHSGPMATGEVLERYLKPSIWFPIPPHSFLHSLLAALC